MSNSPNPEKAKTLARLMLAGKTDKAGEPLFDHAERVAAKSTFFGEVTVSWLHDLVEDTEVTLLDLIHLGFDRDTVKAVDLLTREDGATYREYIARIIEAPGHSGTLARSVKYADLEDHLDRAENISASLCKRYREALFRIYYKRKVKGECYD